MTHDPLCEQAKRHCNPTLWKEHVGGANPNHIQGVSCDRCLCMCDLIAKVRDEERSKDLDYQYIAAQAEADGYRNALNDIVKQIESMLPITLRSLIHNKTRDAVYVDEVIAMIRGKLE